MKKEMLTKKNIADRYVGKYIIVQTYSSCAYFGRVKEYCPDSRHIVLENSRIIFSWKGKFTLYEVSVQGLDEHKLTISIPETTITDVTQIIPLSKEAEKKLKMAVAYQPQG